MSTYITYSFAELAEIVPALQDLIPDSIVNGVDGIITEIMDIIDTTVTDGVTIPGLGTLKFIQVLHFAGNQVAFLFRLR